MERPTTMSNETTNLPNIFPSIYYDDASAAIDWLERAFGFQRRLVVPGPNNSVAHSELTYGPGVIMVGTVRPERRGASARNLAGLHQGICVRVDDPDAHYARAKQAGAIIIDELKNEDYGSRGYLAEDLEGNRWYFGTYQPGAYW